jgi:hypothetical protein
MISPQRTLAVRVGELGGPGRGALIAGETVDEDGDAADGGGGPGWRRAAQLPQNRIPAGFSNWQ